MLRLGIGPRQPQGAYADGYAPYNVYAHPLNAALVSYCYLTGDRSRMPTCLGQVERLKQALHSTRSIGCLRRSALPAPDFFPAR
jgi:hypothetical protein